MEGDRVIAVRGEDSGVVAAALGISQHVCRTFAAGTTSACTPQRRASCLLLCKEESFCLPSKLPSSNEEGTESSPSEARTQGWSRLCASSQTYIGHSPSRPILKFALICSSIASGMSQTTWFSNRTTVIPSVCKYALRSASYAAAMGPACDSPSNSTHNFSAGQ